MTEMEKVAPILSVVMPVFKEGEAVEPVLRALTAGVSTPHEIIVVYDFDEDPTVPVIDRRSGGAAGHPRPAQRPRPRRPERDEGRHGCHRRGLRPHLHGRRLGRAA